MNGWTPEPGWRSFTWFARNRHLLAAGVATTAGLVLLLTASSGVAAAETLDRQLAALVGPGLTGLALLSVGAFAYWAGQRRREHHRLDDVELFVAAVSDAARPQLARRLAEQNRSQPARRPEAGHR